VQTWHTARAPGRVNLIGDHTDYQDGWCLPIAIDRDVRVSYRVRADSRVEATSQGFEGTARLVAGAGFGSTPVPEWARMLDAVLDVLASRGREPVGFDAKLTSTVPVGSGLSSSAAVAVAFAAAAASVAGMALDGTDLALAARDAEHLATGVPCGVMDQMAAVHGRADHALLLDCRTLEVEALPIPASSELVVVHSGVSRRLESSAYAQRRAACEAAAARLGVAALRDATPAQVADDPIARHVVSENQRVLAFARALTRGDLAECGALMLASHASLRDDFAVSTPELDLLVDLAVQEGAFGARLTGAGFGGCIVVLALAGEGEAIAGRLGASYRAATEIEPRAFTVRAVDGAQWSSTGTGTGADADADTEA
jgi:galactokinase